MIKSKILFLIIIVCFSCSNSANKTDLNNSILAFCDATNMKDEVKMSELVYPRLYSENLDKSTIQYMFQLQLNATNKFEVSDIKFEDEPTFVFELNEEMFYVQSYLSKTEIILNNSAITQFKDLADQILRTDPSAKIDEENLFLSYAEKRKVILVKTKQGTYVLPEVFLDFLKVEGLDTNTLKEKFNAL